MAEIAHISRSLIKHSVQKKWYRHLSQRAAVSIILATKDQQTCLLMMQRASHASDPWSGQMAFPGGKQDAIDASITATALRESHEEMGIPAASIERIGRLSDILARPYRAMKKPMVVSPLVFQQRQAFTPELNHEAEDYLWIPLRFFTDTRNRDSMTIEKAGLMHQLPCYHIDEKRIWGLSLMMIDELITALD